jgi:hypothetical protein
MDKSRFSAAAKSKLSSYTWIKLTELNEEQIINILVRISLDASLCKREIESLGFELISTFDNKAILRGRTKNLVSLADLEFIEYIEIGMGLASERN